ncbi:MAG: hypothetical protein ACOYKD_10260 [Anaerolineaceae bacterium]|jgi:hypothetical protein
MIKLSPGVLWKVKVILLVLELTMPLAAYLSLRSGRPTLAAVCLGVIGLGFLSVTILK